MEKIELNPNSPFFFFIKTGSQLPDSFFIISENLKRYQILLIPISIEEFFKIKSNSTKFGLVLNNTIETRTIMDKFRAKYFKFLFIFGGSRLVEVSSFESPDFGKLSKVKEQYFYLSLPEKIDTLCRKLATIYYKNILNNNLWPGGTRAKLPRELDKKDL